MSSLGIYSGGSSAPLEIVAAGLKQRDSRLTWLSPDSQTETARTVVTIPGIVEDIDHRGQNLLYVDHSGGLSRGVVRAGVFHLAHRYFTEVDAAAW